MLIKIDSNQYGTKIEFEGLVLSISRDSVLNLFDSIERIARLVLPKEAADELVYEFLEDGQQYMNLMKEALACFEGFDYSITIHLDENGKLHLKDINQKDGSIDLPRLFNLLYSIDQEDESQSDIKQQPTGDPHSVSLSDEHFFEQDRQAVDYMLHHVISKISANRDQVGLCKATLAAAPDKWYPFIHSIDDLQLWIRNACDYEDAAVICENLVNDMTLGRLSYALGITEELMEKKLRDKLGYAYVGTTDVFMTPYLFARLMREMDYSFIIAINHK